MATLRNANDPRPGIDLPFRVYRLCPCDACQNGKIDGGKRCPACRGEGRLLNLVAEAADAEGLGQAIITTGREDTYKECPLGVLERYPGEQGKWLVLPWLPSPRNVSDAGRVLQGART